MAVIHQTTLTPAKLELVAGWLPAQPWYRGPGEPQLAKTGGFRLDDPAGAVGIEFMVVTEARGQTYLVPLTYRGAACAEAAAGLIGTAEHGVLGRRWVYDGAHDPVLVTQLVALLQGAAVAQAQSISDTPDPTVATRPLTGGQLTVTGSAVAASGPDGTDIRVAAAPAEASRDSELIVHLNRVLAPASGAAGDGSAGPAAQVSATWRLPDGTQAHGTFVTARW